MSERRPRGAKPAAATPRGGAAPAKRGRAQLAAAPAPVAPAIAAPAGLDEFGVALWGDVCDHLEARGLLSMADRCAVERYVRAEQLVRRLRGEWESEGSPVYGHGGATGRAKVVHPVIVAMQNSEAAAQRYAADLGLTPAARLRLGVDRPDQPALPGFGSVDAEAPRVATVRRPGA